MKVKIDRNLDNGQFRRVWCQAVGRSPSFPDGPVVAQSGDVLFVETGHGISARRIVEPPVYASAVLQVVGE